MEISVPMASDTKSVSPKMGEDWGEDLSGVAVYGMVGGAVAFAAAVTVPAILGAAAVGAGVYGSAVGVKRLWNWIRD